MQPTFHASRLLPLLGAGLFLAAPLRADTQTFTDSHAISLTDWADTLMLPQFDPALGTLNSVHLTFQGNILGDARIENLAPSRSTVTTNLAVDINLDSPPLGVSFTLNPHVTNTAALSGFDGTIDFGGTSGRSYLGLTESQSQSVNPVLLIPYIGTGQLIFDAHALGNSIATGSANLVSQFNSSAAAVLTVVYDYTPFVITDCNNNGVDDALDIAIGTSLDCDANNVPDECDPDCGTNGIPDACEPDSDGDGIPDDCDAPPVVCDPIGRRNAGSLLLYPEFDNRAANLTLVTVTNTNCDFTPVGLSGILAGTVDVEFVYVGRYGINGQDLPCLEFNRTHRLSPCDTLTVFTSAHNPGQERGYLYVFAKSPQNGQAIVFNHLIGQEVLLGSTNPVNDSMNAVVFTGVGMQGDATDHDHDFIRDLDGVEYSKAPDELLIPRFLGQDPLGVGIFHSRLILVALSGGTSFTTTVNFLIYNDNEEEISAAYTFYCWATPYLTQISGAFLESYLDGTTNNPGEILGATAHESGWFRVDGNVAQSTAHAIYDPAIYAVLVETASIYSVADLPFELCTQDNGDLLPTGVFGDI